MNDNANAAHDAKCAAVITQIQSRGRSRVAMSSNGRVGHCVRPNSWKNDCWLIDISNLNKVLSINVAQQTCVVETGITFENLCQYLLPLGFLPLVIPEFKNITVGGAINGLGVESSSFRHGLFEDSVLGVKIVTGNGKIIRASKSSSSDLFYGMFGSYGSMGVLVSAEIRLMPATSSVRITYQQMYGASVLEQVATEQWWANGEEKDADFCEAIMYGKEHVVVIRADFVNGKDNDNPDVHSVVVAPSRLGCWWNDMSHWRFWWGRWFYQHAEQRQEEEIVPTLDYLFRHDRGIFWCAQVRGVGVSLCERILMGWYWSSSTAYKAEHLSKSNNDFFRVVQDIAIPVSKQRLQRFLLFLDNSLHLYPLWLCPIRNVTTKTKTKIKKIFSLPEITDEEVCEEEWYVNVGIYGAPTSWDGRPFHMSYVTAHRALEDTTRRLKGRKGLYSTSYYSRSEFEREYDVKRAHDVRRKYFADQCFVDVFTKCCEPVVPSNRSTKVRKKLEEKI